MTNSKGWLKVGRTEKTRQVSAGGFWTIDQLSVLQPAVDRLKVDETLATDIDLNQIERMDTAGACLAAKLLDRLEVKSPQQVQSNEAVDSIMETVFRYKRTAVSEPADSNALVKIIERIGGATLEALDLAACFVVFIGNITRHLIGTVVRPARFRFSQTMTQIELSGFNAIPIISLISFLIGIVIAYQGALQLGKLGADIYTIDLLAVTILREMGILLAAIVIAGRSGSTFAAEIGSMKINEEIDVASLVRLAACHRPEYTHVARTVPRRNPQDLVALAAEDFVDGGGGGSGRHDRVFRKMVEEEGDRSPKKIRMMTS